MEKDISRQIHAAAQEAHNEVWNRSDPPTGVHSGALEAAMRNVEGSAAEAYEQAVRDKCAELGVQERDYYLADPEAASVFAPKCLDNEEDQARIRAALEVEWQRNRADYEAEPGF